MQESLLRLDYWLFDLINQKGSFPLGDAFFPWVTDLHLQPYFKILILPLLIFLFYKYQKKKAAFAFLFLCLALGASDFSGSIVKNQALRLRPFENSEIVATQKSPAGSKSFYSNHTSNMFTLFSYTSQMLPILKAPVLIFAIVVSYSRIYNGVHYPSDVLAGALMGCLWGFLFSWLAKKAISYLARKRSSS